MKSKGVTREEIEQRMDELAPKYVETTTYNLAIEYYLLLVFWFSLGTWLLSVTIFSYSANMTRWIMFRVSALVG